MFSAFQIDPIALLKPDTDTSLRLMMEGQRRGYKVFTYQPQDLVLQGGEVRAWGCWTHINSFEPFTYTQSEPVWQSLHTAAVVWMRQDPPFDMNYITATYLLDHLWRDTRVINNPTSVRTFPEKLIPHYFPDLMPPTLVTSSVTAICDFIQDHGQVVLKPLYGHGGRGIIQVSTETPNLSQVVTDFITAHPPTIQVQEFLPAVRQGDKRILLVNGKPIAWFRRQPEAGNFIANMAAGGQPIACELEQRDREICAKLSQMLCNHGLIFCGADVIDGWLTEVNITSPTGVVTANTLYGTCVERDIWEALEL